MVCNLALVGRISDRVKLDLCTYMCTEVFHDHVCVPYEILSVAWHRCYRVVLVIDGCLSDCLSEFESN